MIMGNTIIFFNCFAQNRFAIIEPFPQRRVRKERRGGLMRAEARTGGDVGASLVSPR